MVNANVSTVLRSVPKLPARGSPSVGVVTAALAFGVAFGASAGLGLGMVPPAVSAVSGVAQKRHFFVVGLLCSAWQLGQNETGGGGTGLAGGEGAPLL